jgi:hypothetical protein
MKSIHHTPGNVQRPCAAILYRCLKYHDWQSDFRGSIALEDGRHYIAGISIGVDRAGKQILRLYLRPLHLYKNPVTPGALEVMK